MLFLQGNLFSHAQDERSHQSIQVEIFETGGNVLFDIYCGPKLSQTYLKAISSANQMKEGETLSPSIKKLLHIEPWLQLLSGDLHHVLRYESALNWSSLSKAEQDPNSQAKLFKWLDSQPIQRYHLFRKPTRQQQKKIFPVELRGMDKPTILSYHPLDSKGQPQKQELLLLKYQYQFNWPPELNSKNGITGTLETSLKTFTSNSIFKLNLKGRGNLLQDSLSLEPSPPEARAFLQRKPSKSHKARRLLFHYAKP